MGTAWEGRKVPHSWVQNSPDRAAIMSGNSKKKKKKREKIRATELFSLQTIEDKDLAGGDAISPK